MSFSARPRALSCLVLFVTLCGAPTRWRPVATAQAVAGAGADARPLPRGTVRMRVAGIWDGYDRTFRADSTRPLLSTLRTDAFGVRALPQLTAAQTAIRALSGVSAFALSLGTLEASGDARTVVTPFALDIGVTDRLSIGVVIPYVETRNNALFILNRSGTSANVGQNPAFAASGGATARAANGALLRQLARSRTQLTAEIARCAAVSATNCDAIRANPTGAAQAIALASATQSAIVAVYGDSVRGGAPVVPIRSSATQSSIDARIEALRVAFVGFGITSLTSGTLPAAASIVNGPAAIARIARDSAYGLDYETLGGTRRAGIGDIDLTATYLWLNTLGSRPVQWLAASHVGVRSQITAGWRFGTAGADRSNDAFDIPIGEGANAMLIRSTTDVVVSRRFWLSGTLRVSQPLADQAMLRRPLLDEANLFVPSVTGRAERTLGRRIEAEIAPRLVIGQFLGLSAGYVYRRASSDRYAFAPLAGVEAATTDAATTVSAPAQSLQSVLFGVTFSTMSSFVRGRAKWPVEVMFTHAEPLSGSGGVVPAVETDRLELRIYSGFPRR